MTTVFFRPQVLAQPATPLEIDWGNPITRDLRFSTYNAAGDYAAGPWNYINGTAARRSVSVGLSVDGKRGVAPLFNGTSSVAVTLPLALAGFSKFTMSFWLWWNSYANGSGKFAFQYWNDAGTQDVGTFFIYPDDSSGNFAFAIASGPSSQASYKITRPSAGAWHFYDFTADLGQSTFPITGVRVDGVPMSNVGGISSYAGPRTLVNNSLSILCRPAGTPTTFAAGRVANVNIWGRILTLAERLSMYQNALQVLRNPMMAVGTPSAAGVGGSASESRWFLMQ